jgi:hypothetical protein
VHTAARIVEIRAFQVDPEDTGHALVLRLGYGVDSAAHALTRIGNQGREKTGGTEVAVRRADGAYRLTRRCVVKQYAATAVYLHIDKTRREQRPTEVFALDVSA